MNTETLIARASSAFACKQPNRINNCSCSECDGLSQLLAGRDPIDLPSRELGDGLVLLGPATLRYFMPGIIRLCLSDDHDEEDICNCFVFSILAQPFSKRSPPEFHPKLGELTLEQTSIILELLQHVSGSWHHEGKEFKRVVPRAIANWTYFLERARIRVKR